VKSCLDESTHKMMKFVDEDVESVPQKELMKYLITKTFECASQAKRSGPKSVRYCPIMIRFATYLGNKCGDSTYRFLSETFSWPSPSTINVYGSYDSNLEDGLLFQTLESMEESMKVKFNTQSRGMVSKRHVCERKDCHANEISFIKTSTYSNTSKLLA